MQRNVLADVAVALMATVMTVVALVAAVETAARVVLVVAAMSRASRTCCADQGERTEIVRSTMSCKSCLVLSKAARCVETCQ
jgi:hypothetical protein